MSHMKSSVKWIAVQRIHTRIPLFRFLLRMIKSKHSDVLCWSKWLTPCHSKIFILWSEILTLDFLIKFPVNNSFKNHASVKSYRKKTNFPVTVTNLRNSSVNLNGCMIEMYLYFLCNIISVYNLTLQYFFAFENRK